MIGGIVLKVKEVLNLLQISYNNEIYIFSEYENKIAEVLDSILNSKSKKNVLISVENQSILFMLFVYLCLYDYYKNLINADRSILDILKKDDTILYGYEGKTYLYKGIYDKGREKFIKFSDKKHCDIFIPISKSYMISKYNGNFSRINNPEENVFTNMSKKIISRVFNTNIENLNGYIYESTIFVIKGKQKLFDFIKKVKLKYDNRFVSITKIFPIGYYSSLDNYENIDNKVYDKHVLKFVSDLNTAVDIAEEDEGIKNIVIIGEDSYKNSINLELRELDFIPHLEKLIIIDTWDSNADLQKILLEGEYKFYEISPNFILDNINLYDKSIDEYRNVLQKDSYNKINNLLNKEIEIKEIPDSDTYNNNIEKSINDLKELIVYSNTNQDIFYFIKTAYSLCNKISECIIPLSKFKDNYIRMKRKVEALNECRNLYSKNELINSLLTNIIDNINLCIEDINIKNYRYSEIKSYAYKRDLVLVLLKNRIEAEELRKLLKLYDIRNIKVNLVNDKINISNFKTIIVPFVPDYTMRKILNTNISQKVKFILYKRQIVKMKALIKFNSNIMTELYNSNGLIDNDEYSEVLITNYRKELEEKNIMELEGKYSLELENKVQTYISKEWDLFGELDGYNYECISQDYSKYLTAQCRARFEEGGYSYFTDRYRVNILDYENNNIKLVKFNELNERDQIIFVDGKDENNQDIIKIIIDKLLNFEEFKNKYGVYYNKNAFWKNCIKEYMVENYYSIEELTVKFKNYGINIKPNVIKKWLNDDIIGPQNVNVIRKIAAILDNKKLTEDIDNIIEACCIVRKLQVRIRKIITRIIKENLLCEERNEEPIYKLINSIICSFGNCVQVRTIEFIEAVNKPIKPCYANKLLGREK